MPTGYIHTSRVKKIKLEERTVKQNGIVTPSEGYDGLSSVTVEVPETIIDRDNPIIANTTEEVTALLKSTNVGKVLKYVGTTDVYEQNRLYLIKENE